MSEFDDIEGFDGWQAKLAQLLAEAETAAKNPDIDVRLKLSRRLTDFIASSRPNTAEIVRLDKIAEEAASNLLRITVEERIAAIRERTTELTKLAKQFETIAGSAEAAAKSIRLERAHRAVDSLTGSIRALTQLRDSLAAGSDDEIAKNLDQTIAAIQRFRSLVEKGVA